MNVGRKVTKASRLIKSSVIMSSIEMFKFFTLEKSITVSLYVRWYQIMTLQRLHLYLCRAEASATTQYLPSADVSEQGHRHRAHQA